MSQAFSEFKMQRIIITLDQHKKSSFFPYLFSKIISFPSVLVCSSFFFLYLNFLSIKYFLFSSLAVVVSEEFFYPKYSACIYNYYFNFFFFFCFRFKARVQTYPFRLWLFFPVSASLQQQYPNRRVLILMIAISAMEWYFSSSYTCFGMSIIHKTNK